MGKGNIILGFARGKVGDVVFYRALGAQQMRAYVGSIDDPKTDNQYKYRLRIPNVLNAYKILKNEYSFEGARKNNNYYNRFMRANLSRYAVNNFPAYLTKEEALQNFAVGDNYIVSQGSLKPFFYLWESNHSTEQYIATNDQTLKFFPFKCWDFTTPSNQAIHSDDIYASIIDAVLCMKKYNLTLCQAFTKDNVFIHSAKYLTITRENKNFSSLNIHHVIYFDTDSLWAFPSDDGSACAYMKVTVQGENTSKVELGFGLLLTPDNDYINYIQTAFYSCVSRDGNLKVSFSQFPTDVLKYYWAWMRIERYHSQTAFEEAVQSYGGGADIPYRDFDD